jgi:hypothetical protein
MLRVMNKRRSALLTLLLTALPILAADAGRIVDGTAFVIEEAFVDAARGREIGAALRKQNVDTKLEGAALAEAITQAIWKIENDGHLNVRFDPAKAGTPLASRDELRARLQDTGPRLVRRMPGSEALESQVSSRMLEGGVGVLEIRLFSGEPAHFTDAIAKIEDARAVIVDLRGNRGGSQQLVNYVASYFFPADSRVLLTSRFRTEPEPRVNRVVPTPTRKLENVPLTILVDDGTFSAGEAFAYILQQYGRAKVVGVPTRGGGRHNTFIDLGAGYRVSVSIGSVEHPKTKTGWQATGIVPDVRTSSEEALEKAVGLMGGGAAPGAASVSTK